MKLQKLDKTLISKLLPSPIFPSMTDDCESKHACTLCNLKFLNENDLINHQSNETINSIKYKKSRCSYCSLTFSSYRGMKQHFGKIHEKKKNIPCTICGKLFKDKYAIKFHIEHVHETSKRVQCENCSFLCYTKYVYQAHKQNCPTPNPPN